MRGLGLKMAFAAAALALGGCVGPYYGGGGFAYDGFYDNSYGPIYDGYWGRNDVFYYRNAGRGRYVRDRGGHFSRSERPGFTGMHGLGPRGRGIRGGGFRNDGGIGDSAGRRNDGFRGRAGRGRN